MKQALNRSGASDLRVALSIETDATVSGLLDPDTTNRVKDF